jgi:hypothetical protein
VNLGDAISPVIYMWMLDRIFIPYNKQIRCTKDRKVEMIKNYDSYHSTGRNNVKMVNTIKEALSMDPMELPNFEFNERKINRSFFV